MKYIFQLIFVLYAVSLFSQHENKEMVDSLISVLESPVVSLDDFDGIEIRCSEINRISKNIHYNEGVFVSNLILAQVYRDFSVAKTQPYFDVLDSMLSQGINIETNRLLEYHLAKGYFFGSAGDFYNELENYLIADSICQDQDLPEWEHFVKQHITNYYTVNEDYVKALTLIKEIVSSWEETEIEDTLSYVMSVSNLGIAYSHLEEYDSAVFHLKRSFDLGLGDYIRLQYHYITIAECYLGLDSLDKAQEYLMLSKELLSPAEKFTIDFVDYNRVSALFFMEKIQYDSAVFYARNVVFYSDSLNFINGQKSGNELLLKASLHNKGENELLSAFSKYKLANDSITKRKSLRMEKESAIKYEVLKKENKIIELELKNQIERRTKWLIFFALLATLIIGVYFLNKYKVKAVLLKQRIKIEQFEKSKIEENLRQKENELTSKIDMLQSNLKIIDQLREQSESTANVDELIKAFDQRYIDESKWGNIILQFQSIHQGYIQELQSINANVTTNDIKLAILIKLNYSNKGMAEVLNISNEGVKKAKQRLKKKVVGFEFSQKFS